MLDFRMQSLVNGQCCCLTGTVVGRASCGQVAGLRSYYQEVAMVVRGERREEGLGCPKKTQCIHAKGTGGKMVRITQLRGRERGQSKQFNIPFLSIKNWLPTAYTSIGDDYSWLTNFTRIWLSAFDHF